MINIHNFKLKTDIYLHCNSTRNALIERYLLIKMIFQSIKSLEMYLFRSVFTQRLPLIMKDAKR